MALKRHALGMSDLVVSSSRKPRCVYQRYQYVCTVNFNRYICLAKRILVEGGFSCFICCRISTDMGIDPVHKRRHTPRFKIILQHSGDHPKAEGSAAC